MQATIIILRDSVNALRDSKAPAAQRSYQDLPCAIDKAQVSLDQLVDFIQTSVLRKGKGVSRLSLHESKRKRLAELRGIVTEAHQNLQLLFHSANLFVNPYYVYLLL